MLDKSVLIIALSICLATNGVAYAEESKRTFTDEQLETMPAPGPNPYISFLPVEAEVDWEYWRAKMSYEARLKAEAEAA
ncbi:MAG: hypothetical protein AAF446_05250, partial [Pseudomonadota bacterium]